MKAEKWLSEAGPQLLALIEKEPERNADVYVVGEGEAERGVRSPHKEQRQSSGHCMVAMKGIRQVTVKDWKKKKKVEMWVYI